MMEGVQLILGKDWLDMMNPLVDWRSNTVFLRHGSQLEPVQGIREKSGTHCQIVDKGLNGLQCYFRDLRRDVGSPTTDLGHQLAVLSSPQFWQYDSLAQEWVRQPAGLHLLSSPGTADVPQGGSTNPKNFSPGSNRDPHYTQGPSRSRTTRTRRVARKCVRQSVREKLDFISLRQTVKRANKTDQPMFLCVLRATELPVQKRKRPKAKVGAAHGMTEGKKRRISKETSPVTQDVPVETVI